MTTTKKELEIGLNVVYQWLLENDFKIIDFKALESSPPFFIISKVDVFSIVFISVNVARNENSLDNNTANTNIEVPQQLLEQIKIPRSQQLQANVDLMESGQTNENGEMGYYARFNGPTPLFIN